MTPEERRARNIALANTDVPRNPKIEEAFEDIWSGTKDLDHRGLSQQFIDGIKAVSHDFFESGVIWAQIGDTLDEIQEQREALLDNIQEINKAALDLIDAVEKYVRQECLRSELLARKDNLKKLLEK